MSHVETLEKMLLAYKPNKFIEGDTCIEYEYGPLVDGQLEEFEKGTGSLFTGGQPPTLATIFRWAEFRWLLKDKIDMRTLLHTDQEYEYFHPVKTGAVYWIRTWKKSVREKRGLKFINLVSEIYDMVDGQLNELVIKTSTSFVLRESLVG